MSSVFTVVRLLTAIAIAVLLVDTTLIESLLVKHALRTIALVWIATEISRLFVQHIAKSSTLPSRWSSVLTAAFGLVMCLLVLEVVWTFIPRSHGVGYTYAARNWFHYYWSTNDLGYRDRPIQEIDTQQATIAVLGDSFTAGHGIVSEHDTFAGQLRASLEGRAEVLNLGRNGSDTRNALNRLQQYPLRIDYLVLQYFGNDIEMAAIEAGMDFGTAFQPYEGIDIATKTVLLGSYLANYAYWLFPHTDTSGYADSLSGAYRDQAILSRHLSDLRDIIEYAEMTNMPTIVVLFPLLTDLEYSRDFVEPVREFFLQNNVPVVDVSELVESLPISSRIVNVNDAHPSELVHNLVATSLVDAIDTANWLGDHEVELR